MPPKRKAPKAKAKEKPRGPGRPATQPRGRLFIRANEVELAEWTEAAASRGIALSSWVRDTCNAAVRR